jgi:predicted amidohydrolase
MPHMNFLGLQLDVVWENKAANFAKARALLAAAKPEPNTLVVLPEMFSTGFSMDLAITRQSADRPDETFLAALAREFGVYVIGGAVSPGDGVMARNQSLSFSPDGKLLTRYTKIHPSCLGGEGEKHERGSEIFTFPCEKFTVAPFVCYDLRFPEIFRAAAKRGANLFVVIALWPAKRQQHWLTLLQARAIENQAYVIGVNRVGEEPGYTYPGRSVVVDPHGVIIADAGGQERSFSAMLDLEVVEAWRREFPALRDAHWRDPSA